MSVKNPVKRADREKIACGDLFTMTLGLTAQPDIAEEPADLVLVLDVSASMVSYCALQHMTQGADDLIDIITVSTGGTKGETVGGESCIGAVSFSTEAAVLCELTQDAAAIKEKISLLTAGGMTNHSEAMKTALAMFDLQSTKRKIMVLFTDGITSQGPDPQPAAEAIRAAGIELYCIGLNAPAGVLAEWASEPAAEYVLDTTDASELEEMFREVGRRTSKAGLQDAVIEEILAENFRIVDIVAPQKGTVRQTGSRSLCWEIGLLGAETAEDARLRFTAEYTGNISGTFPVNEAVRYSDRRGGTLEFPAPEITVECGEQPVIPDPCPPAVDFCMNSCEDAAVIDLRQTEPDGLGRIVQLGVTVKNICPGRRVAVAVQLTEPDADGREHPRGLKCFTVPAHHDPACRDVTIGCIRFVLPEDLDVSGGSAKSICNVRCLRARVMANYIDTDFICCKQG